MVKIVSFSIGNKDEAFITESFNDGINIIHSNDNNKGKTIVVQGIMYALGNMPVFPKGFDNFNEYYYVVDLSVNDRIFTICRKTNSFFVKTDGAISIYESVSDFRNFFNKEIYNLPIIQKDGRNQQIGLELFYQLFFLPQDNRSTHSLIGKTRYKKDDLLNSVYSIAGCNVDISPDFVHKVEEELHKLNLERKALSASKAFINSASSVAAFATYAANKKNIDEKLRQITVQRDILSDLINARNRAYNKRTKNEILLKEIASLNRELPSGHFVCLDCGSPNIAYEASANNMRFDITDTDTREMIFLNITNQINSINDEIATLDNQILDNQKILNELLSDENINLEMLLFHKKDLEDVKDVDSKIIEIDRKISQLESELIKKENANKNKLISKKAIFDNLLEKMNYFYRKADSEDPLVITDVFTKSNINYSGSQGAIYLMSRVFAYSKVLNIDFPIIIDHFRGGEISSIKEEKILPLLKELNKQVIITCTLKAEERNKYDDKEGIKSISFDNIIQHKLLQPEYNDKFKKKMRDLLIVL